MSDDSIFEGTWGGQPVTDQYFRSAEVEWELAYSTYSGEQMYNYMEALSTINAKAYKANQEIENANIEGITKFDQTLTSQVVAGFKVLNYNLKKCTETVHDEVKENIDDPFGTAITTAYGAITLISGHGLIDGDETVADDIQNFLDGKKHGDYNATIDYFDLSVIEKTFGEDVVKDLKELSQDVVAGVGYYMWQVDGVWFSFYCDGTGRLQLIGMSAATPNVSEDAQKVIDEYNQEKWKDYNALVETNEKCITILGDSETAVDVIEEFQEIPIISKPLKLINDVILGGKNIHDSCYDEYGNWDPTAASVQRAVTDTAVDIFNDGLSLALEPKTPVGKAFVHIVEWGLSKTLDIDLTGDGRGASDVMKDWVDDNVDILTGGRTS